MASGGKARTEAIWQLASSTLENWKLDNLPMAWDHILGEGAGRKDKL
jgi:hypothetical protein